MVDSTTVTTYFSQVLERTRLDEVLFKDESYVLAPRDAVEQGRLTSDDTAKLFAIHEENASQRKTSKRSDVRKGEDPQPNEAPRDEDGADDTEPGRPTKDRSLPVVLSTVTLVPGKNSPGGPSGLLLLSALLHTDGRLEPDLNSNPFAWIPSERLSTPSVTDREVMAGSLTDFWTYTMTHLGAETTHVKTLRDALTVADGLFEAVAHTSREAFVGTVDDVDSGATIDLEHVYIQEVSRINAVGGLIDIYTSLSREDHDRKTNGRGKTGRTQSIPPLIDRMIQGWTSERTSEMAIHDGDGLLDSARRSCGSMSDGFPLTASQRRAVHAFLTDDSDGEVTAVSGPPGTGKTTMLQSIVANLLTRRALDRADPPVIVGMSTNNQAVTNVISSFASVTKDEPGTLDFRWLPEAKDGATGEEPMSSLAVYCPANGKLDEAKKHYLVEQRDRSETYTDFSTDKYIAAATDRFLANADAYFGHTNTVDAMRATIHEELSYLDACRLGLIDAMAKHGPDSRLYQARCAEVAENERWAACVDASAFEKLKECADLASLDQQLDTTLRYLQFWLAVHYFESQWLTAEFIDADDRGKTTWPVRTAYWRQAAALTPCFVMTAYQVPKYFQKYTKDRERKEFDTGRIDLLIVDEAGQVDTPIGLPAFAVAKRAVVVGDEKQLAPVWSLDEVTDQQMADGAGIAAHDWTGELRPRGLTCSNASSLMRAASHASRWTFGDENPGLFLSEHFRCHPTIIGYCNRLLYDGLLQPMRPAESSRLEGTTKAFLFAEVPGSESRQQGSSRANPAEAKAIATWIVENFAHFYAEYNETVEDVNGKVDASTLIGVVTPFSAQARLISQELSVAAEAAEVAAGIPGNLAALVTVGTAHKLQGAERPIVLFSAVYGDNNAQSPFIDSNLSLMNVAVSRAKDLFIVFAAKRRWDNGRVFSLMAEEDFADRDQSIDFAGVHTAEVGEDAAETEVVESTAIPPKPQLPPILPAGDDGTAEEAVETVPVSDEPAEVPVEPCTADDRTSLSLSSVLREWKDAGLLRADDEDIKANAFNLRLEAAGILEDKPGSWAPSRLAGRLGVDVVTREKADGESYDVIEYSPQFQDLLLDLYRARKV